MGFCVCVTQSQIEIVPIFTYTQKSIHVKQMTELKPKKRIVQILICLNNYIQLHFLMVINEGSGHLFSLCQTLTKNKWLSSIRSIFQKRHENNGFHSSMQLKIIMLLLF